MRKFLSGVAAAALLLSGCVAPEGDQANSAGTNAAASNPNDADPALWLVKDADTNIYLFGTVHVLKPGQTWFDEAVRAAYDRSDEVVLEVVDPDSPANATTITRLARSADGRPLRDKLSAATRAKYDAAMQGLGVPPTAFDGFDPWFAAITLSLLPITKSGYDLNSGAEKVLTSTARSNGKSLGQLETVEQQLGIFDSLPQDQQIRLLESTLDEADGMVAQLDEIARFWAAGDPERLGAIMNEAFRATPQLGKALLADRNARWAQWIDDRMDKPGTVFVAVGAGHLAGNDSVQNMLKARKLNATRVRY